MNGISNDRCFQTPNEKRKGDQPTLFGFTESPPAEAVSFTAPTPEATARPPPQDDWHTPIKCPGPEAGRQSASEILKLVEKNHYHFESWDRAFTEPLELMVYGLNRQEDAYMEKVRGMKRQAVQASAQMLGPVMKALTCDYAIYDVLGDVYMQLA